MIWTLPRRSDGADLPKGLLLNCLGRYCISLTGWKRGTRVPTFQGIMFLSEQTDSHAGSSGIAQEQRRFGSVGEPLRVRESGWWDRMKACGRFCLGSFSALSVYPPPECSGFGNFDLTLDGGDVLHGNIPFLGWIPLQFRFLGHFGLLRSERTQIDRGIAPVEYRKPFRLTGNRIGVVATLSASPPNRCVRATREY